MSSLAEDFTPREWQEEIIGNPQKDIPEDKTKYKVVVAHRKSGKTVMALMYLFMKAYQCKDGFAEGSSGGSIRVPRFTYIAPTYKQAQDIAWDLLKDIVPPQMLLKKPNETKMEIRLTNRCIINLKGSEKEDSLRGPGLYFALMDEYAQMKPHIWETIIKPELAATGGGAMFIGTPSGRGQFYDVFKLGRDGIPNWKSWLLPATRKTLGFKAEVKRGQDLLAYNFLEETKNETTEKWYNQEYECEFLDDAGQVFDRIDQNVIDDFREFPEAGHRYRLGFDPALHEDWSVITVVDLTDHIVKYVYRTSKLDAELLYSKIENESNRWTTEAGRPEIVMDTTGMGDPMYDTLISRGLSITPIKFSNKNKMEMVKNLASRFNKDEIKIPRYEWLIDELKEYTYVRLLSGRYRYGAPDGQHDDGVTALMLAYWQIPPLTPVVRNRRGVQQQQYNKFTGY